MEKKELSSDKRIDYFVDMMGDFVLSAGGKKEGGLIIWPFHPMLPRALYWGGDFIMDLYNNLHQLTEKYSDEEIAKLFNGSGRLSNILFNFDGLPMSALSKDEKIWLITKIFDLLSFYRKADIFCKDGRNTIWNKEKITQTLKNIEWTDVKEGNFKRNIERFEAMLWSFTELIYFANHAIGHEFHGPYETKDGLLLVKEFYDLKPEFWNFTKELIFTNIKIFEIYKKDTTITIDFFGRGVRSIGSYRQNLLKIYMQIDDIVIRNEKQIEEYIDVLEKVIGSGVKEAGNLNQKALFQKYMEAWYWAMKPLSERLNKSWKPSEKLYEKFKQDIDPTPLLKNLEKIGELPLEQQKILLSKRFDPRS
jgi:hypothetical protein